MVDAYRSDSPVKCRCGHTNFQHLTVPSGARKCKHWGCGCDNFDPAPAPVTMMTTEVSRRASRSSARVSHANRVRIGRALEE